MLFYVKKAAFLCKKAVFLQNIFLKESYRFLYIYIWKNAVFLQNILLVVMMATISPNQSERSNFGLDQSESRISPMWQMWRHIAHIWSWNSRDPIGIKNTRTQELNPHSLHSFNDRVKSWVQAGRVWRPSDVTPITNLITGRVRSQSSRSHRDNWNEWRHQ